MMINSETIDQMSVMADEVGTHGAQMMFTQARAAWKRGKLIAVEVLYKKLKAKRKEWR
ncbi:MAG: hypothetical protein ACPGXY_03170 [Alphaproteobacteria bacterium]